MVKIKDILLKMTDEGITGRKQNVSILEKQEQRILEVQLPIALEIYFPTKKKNEPVFHGFFMRLLDRFLMGLYNHSTVVEDMALQPK